MPCPTCGHTVALLCTKGCKLKTDYYHCGRCGTVVFETPDGREAVHVPQLVERCRRLLQRLPPPQSMIAHVLGVAESINTPENRTATPTQETAP